MRRSLLSVVVGALAGLVWASPAGAATTGDIARDDLGVASLLLAAAGWLVFLGVRERWGREDAGARRDDDGETVYLLDEPPALVDSLRHRGAIRPVTLGAIVLDLARRGYLTIAEEHREGFLGRATEWRFRREDPPRGSLSPYENAVYARLFVTGSDVWLSDIAAWVRSNRQQARVLVERIGRYVAAELGDRGYLERGGRLPSILNLSAVAVVALVSLGALVSGSLLGLAGIASGAAQAFLGQRLRRRTATGADRARQWMTVADALAAVEELEEAPADSREGWERCLVYAATLGVSGEFLDGMRAREATLLDDAGFAGWYESPRDDPHRLDSIGRFVVAVGEAFGDVVEPPRMASRLVNARR